VNTVSVSLFVLFSVFYFKSEMFSLVVKVLLKSFCFLSLGLIEFCDLLFTKEREAYAGNFLS